MTTEIRRKEKIRKMHKMAVILDAMKERKKQKEIKENKLM